MKVLFDSIRASRLGGTNTNHQFFLSLSLVVPFHFEVRSASFRTRGLRLRKNAFLHREFRLYLHHSDCDSSTSISMCNLSNFLSRFLWRSLVFYFKILFLKCSSSVSISSLRVSGFRAGKFIGVSLLVQCSSLWRVKTSEFPRTRVIAPRLIWTFRFLAIILIFLIKYGFDHFCSLFCF